MAKGLVIVESPAKAKTIQKYLGTGYEVEASLGHIKDLPKKSLGVDLDNDFSTEYVVIPGKEKVVARLKKLAKSADTIYLAPDPDREGEAIAAHLAEELGGERVDGKKRRRAARPTSAGSRSTRSPSALCRKRSSIRVTSTAIWWTRSRPAGCSTGWSATRSHRCCGTKCAADYRPDACRPSRYGSSSSVIARSRRSSRKSTGRLTRTWQQPSRLPSTPGLSA